MNIFLWVLQFLLAAHTLMGAIWKFSNATQSVPSLEAIPPNVWLAMSFIEILCALGLVLPVVLRKQRKLAPIASLLIAVEMLGMSVVHLNSGATDHGPMIYWLVVAAICLFLAYARFVLNPIRSEREAEE